MNTDLQNMNVTVLMGGDSAEREISIKSGTAVADALELAGARVTRLDHGYKRLAPGSTHRNLRLQSATRVGGEDGQIQGCSSPWGFTIQDPVCWAVHCAWTKPKPSSSGRVLGYPRQTSRSLMLVVTSLQSSIDWALCL